MLSQKAIIVPIEQKEEFGDLIRVYSEAYRLAYAGCNYSELRKKFPEYNSQVTNNARHEAENYRKTVVKSLSIPKKLLVRNYAFLRRQDIDYEKGELIYKPFNRIKFKYYPSDKQQKEIELATIKGARIVKNKEDRFMLHIQLEKNIELRKWQECETVIGVDIGITNLAVCTAISSDGKTMNPLFFKGGEWKNLCRRKRKIETTKGKKLTRRQHEIFHTVAKRIVEHAKQFGKPIIILEKLNNFRGKTKNKWLNFLLANWARKELHRLIEYKANWDAIPVAYRNPYKTSKICHYCDVEGIRKGSTFTCLNCGRIYDADANASINLAKRFRRQFLNEPNAMTEERSSTDLSSVGEGNTYLPETQTKFRPACQMTQVMSADTEASLGIGGA